MGSERGPGGAKAPAPQPLHRTEPQRLLPALPGAPLTCKSRDRRGAGPRRFVLIPPELQWDHVVSVVVLFAFRSFVLLSVQSFLGFVSASPRLLVRSFLFRLGDFLSPVVLGF